MRKFLLTLWLWLFTVPAFAVTGGTTIGDAAYTILPTDQVVYTSTAFTAGRTWTLPSAGASCIGQTCPRQSLEIVDKSGAISASYPLTIAAASGETINGQTGNLIISAPYARVILIPTSGTGWFAVVSGDYVSSAVATASAVSLTTATGKTITSVSLSQGQWSCYGALTRKLAASTSVTQLKTSISTTTDTSGSLDTGTMTQLSVAANVMAADTTQTIGPIIVSPTSTTTYYLVAQDTFTVSTNAGYGQLICQRR